MILIYSETIFRYYTGGFLISKYLKLVTILFLFSILASTANAATLKVGKTSYYKYHTIQSAVDNSKTGDTILVSNGSYREVVNFKNVTKGDSRKKLLLRGENKKGKYVYPRVYGFSIKNNDPAVDIDGFKLTRYGIFNEGYGSDDELGPHIYRNNYFENCGISINNQFCQTSLIKITDL
jgi:hypothetical protein